MQEALIDYKLGMMDPAREAAAFEKQSNIKKYIGKKLKLMEITKHNKL